MQRLLIRTKEALHMIARRTDQLQVHQSVVFE
jgi:hypothetical protein